MLGIALKGLSHKRDCKSWIYGMTKEIAVAQFGEIPPRALALSGQCVLIVHVFWACTFS